MRTPDTADLTAIAQILNPDALQAYRRDKRMIRFQDRRAQDGNLARKAVDGIGHRYRYLVIRGNRAMFQCDDSLDAVMFMVDHPGCKCFDLDDLSRSERKLVGQFLAVRESTITIPPPERRDHLQLASKFIDKPGRVPKPMPDKDFRKVPQGVDVTDPVLKWLWEIGAVKRAIPETIPADHVNVPIFCTGCGYNRKCQCAPAVEPTLPEPRFYRTYDPSKPLSQDNAIPVW